MASAIVLTDECGILVLLNSARPPCVSDFASNAHNVSNIFDIVLCALRGQIVCRCRMSSCLPSTTTSLPTTPTNPDHSICQWIQIGIHYETESRFASNRIRPKLHQFLISIILPPPTIGVMQSGCPRAFVSIWFCASVREYESIFHLYYHLSIHYYYSPITSTYMYSPQSMKI